MSKNQGEGIKHKIKTLLGLRKTHHVPAIGIENEEEQEYIFTVDKLKELSRENNINHRSRVLKELCDVVASRRLEEHATEAVWNEISDMLQISTPTEPRQSALRFLVFLAAGQAQRLGIFRAQFLRLIENHHVKEDLNYRIELLISLTDNGKDISYCEHIGPFLLRFSTEVLEGDRTEEFLTFLINLVHFNSSFLDKEIITGLVELTCDFCNKAKVEREIESCLQLLDAIVRYSGLPSDGLYPLIATLCRTVNIESFCQASWKLLKTLVGTRLGHSTIFIMCCILEDENNLNDSILLRGAVFFIGMCIWGSKRVTSLQHKPISLLPSFKQALHGNHPIVAREIGLSLQRLVKKYGKELQIVTWDIILDLIDMLMRLQQSIPGGNEPLKGTLHDLLSTIEDLYNTGKFDGSAERFFGIIERCSSQRPDSSVLTLLSFLHESIHPAKDGWLDRLKNILEKYFKKDARTAIRVKVLDIISAVLTSYRFWYEDELIDLAILSYLNDIDKERDPTVRLVTAQLLVDLISAFTSHKCLDILAILRKLMNRLMDSSGLTKKPSDDQLITDGEHLRDIRIAVSGLVTTFKHKLVESPTLVAIKILEMLVEHISLHYINGFTARTGAEVRLEIFGLFLNIRADDRHRLGVIKIEEGKDEEEIRFSVFATCNPKSREHSHAISNVLGRRSSLTNYCATARTFEAILNCLKDEWEWNVLQFVLANLPDQLRNKTLILGDNADVTNLCVSLCTMVNDGQFLNKVKNVPPGSGRTDLHNFIFPIMAVLVTYNDTIDKARQIDLVKSLELGLNSQCARLCVICLTICILEMKSVMLRTLPSILIKLSKISATVPMSIPMLEFLSSLKEITELYSNFVEEQYMSIFAIALPYTDAHRYSQYTVTLAHYVIASWFTRCRLSFRKGFVRLITKGLQSSAITRPTQLPDKVGNESKMSNLIEETHEFHEDMTEVCSDMMAKYSFSTISNQPNRSSVAQFILANGSSQSWLVGNTLVTVTTSDSPLNECAICKRKKVKHDASRAAAKLRLFNTNIDNMLENRSKPSLPRAADGGEDKAAEIFIRHALAGGSREQYSDADSYPIEKESMRPTLEVRGDAVLKQKSDLTTFQRDEPVVVCDIPESQAIENPVQCKHSRVDSAMEVTEEAESYRVESSISDVTDSSDRVENNEEILPADKTPVESSEGRREKVLVDSLVGRLALEQQDVGHAFSPTHYFLNEVTSVVESSTQADSPMETKRDEGDSKHTDVQKDWFEEVPNTKSLAMEKNVDVNAEDMPESRLLVESRKADCSVTVSTLNAELDIRSHAMKREEHNILGKPEKVIHSSKTKVDDQRLQPQESARNEVESPDSLERPTINCTEPLKEACDRKYHEEGDNYLLTRQNIQRVQPTSNTTSQNSSVQTSPLVSRRTSLQAATEFPPQHVFSEKEDAPSSELRPGADLRPNADEVCSCSTESWAEIMIRRPTGNTSWVMKLENAMDSERNFSGIEDIASLAAAMEVEDFAYAYRDICDARPEEKAYGRSRLLSTITDELSRDRQSNRSSSDSPRSFFNETTSDSPSTLRRRRFSTGSMDIPSVFEFSVPSPDPQKEKDEISEGSYGGKYLFQQPSVGFSPLSSLRRAGSSSSIGDLKDRTKFSFNDLVLSSSHKSDIRRKPDAFFSIASPDNNQASIATSHINRSLVDDSKTLQTGHVKLSKALSSPTKVSATRLVSSSVDSTEFHRSSSVQARSVLTESINKEFENQKQVNGKMDKISKEVDARKSLRSKADAESLKKEELKRARDICSENQSTRRGVEKGEDQRVSILPSVNITGVKSDGPANVALPLKDPQKKEAFKTGAQAIKEKISSFSAYRPRGTTISSYPVSKHHRHGNENKNLLPDRSLNSPLNPYFVFLQFFYSPFITAGGIARPLLLNSGEVIERAVKVLDHIPPYNYHKIGIIYVGPGQQSHETCILANQYGSSRYVKFLQGIGKLISLLDCSRTDIYTGGLDRNGGDGKFACSWRDSITQVIFHVATLMPNKQSDPACNSKKLHIGNNFVTIVYNDSSKPYTFGTIKGQFNFAEVVIKPLDYSSNLVNVRMKEDLRNVVTNTEPHVISDENLPFLVRQLAVHTNMATVLHYNRSKPSNAYGCNWLERLKQIKRIRAKAAADNQGPPTHSSLSSSKTLHSKRPEFANSDFTDYT